jgi:hypothetical protein
MKDQEPKAPSQSDKPAPPPTSAQPDKDKKPPENQTEDQPGADGFSSARADEDTYD